MDSFPFGITGNHHSGASHRAQRSKDFEEDTERGGITKLIIILQGVTKVLSP